MVAATSSPVRSSLAPPAGWRRCALIAAVAAPVLFLVGQALLPSLPDSLPAAFDAMLAQRDRVTAAQLVTAAGGFLFLPALAVVLWLVPPGTPGRSVLVTGAVLFGLGTFSNALSQVVEAYVMRAATAPGVPREAGLAVFGRLGEGAVGIPVGFWSIPAFALGLIVMASGLLRSRALPVWQPVLVITGTLLAAATAGIGPVVALTQAPLTAGLLAWSLTAARRGYAASGDGA